jgi:hypothetical protein
VSIGTDTFVRNFVAKTCRNIIDDVEKLNLNNRCVLQQQNVDCKIVDVLLKRGTNQDTDGWDASSKVSITSRFVSWVGAFFQERHRFWLSKDDLRDSSSWSSSPLLLH